MSERPRVLIRKSATKKIQHAVKIFIGVSLVLSSLHVRTHRGLFILDDNLEGRFETPVELDLQKDTNSSKAIDLSGPISDRNVFRNFLMHIPKTGLSYGVQAMNQEMIFASPQYENLSPGERFRICDEGLKPTKLFGHPKKEVSYADSQRGAKCLMWMAESQLHHYHLPHSKNGTSSRGRQPVLIPPALLPQHIYTVVRDPRQHVLSQFFHCKESKHSKNRKRSMAKDLDTWLQTWVSVMEKEKSTTSSGNENPEKKKALGFKCYDPRNMQSKWVRSVLESPHNFARDDAWTVENLLKAFQVMGDMKHIDKSLCLIVIQVVGWVPQVCDCTKESFNIKSPGAGYNPKHHSHGVRHHGATYITTPEQDHWIDLLTQDDQLLYNLTKQVFTQQVEATEEKHSMRICDVLQRG